MLIFIVGCSHHRIDTPISGDTRTDSILQFDIHKTLFGISPRDMSQYIALKHGILNPDVSVLFLVGGAGSGKTLLSYAGAIYQILEYSKEHIKKKGWENPFEVKSTTDNDLIDPLNKSDYVRKYNRAALYRDLILLKPDDPL